MLLRMGVDIIEIVWQIGVANNFYFTNREKSWIHMNTRLHYNTQCRSYIECNTLTLRRLCVCRTRSAIIQYIGISICIPRTNMQFTTVTMQTFVSVYNWPIHNSICRPLYLYTRPTDPFTTLYADLYICIQHPLIHSQLYMQTFASIYKTH